MLYSQSSLIEKISNFLQYKSNKDISYSKDFIRTQITESGGFCNGLSTMWAYARRISDQEKATNTVRDDIENFNLVYALLEKYNSPQDFEGMSSEEQVEIERFISNIAYFQTKAMVTEQSKKQLDLESSLRDTKNNQFIKTLESNSLTVTQEILSDRLEKVLSPHSLIFLSAGYLKSSHMTAAYVDQAGKIYYYDPNNGEREAKDSKDLASHYFETTATQWDQTTALDFQLRNSTITIYQLQEDINSESNITIPEYSNSEILSIFESGASFVSMWPNHPNSKGIEELFQKASLLDISEWIIQGSEDIQKFIKDRFSTETVAEHFMSKGGYPFDKLVKANIDAGHLDNAKELIVIIGSKFKIYPTFSSLTKWCSVEIADFVCKNFMEESFYKTLIKGCHNTSDSYYYHLKDVVRDIIYLDLDQRTKKITEILNKNEIEENQELITKITQDILGYVQEFSFKLPFKNALYIARANIDKPKIIEQLFQNVQKDGFLNGFSLNGYTPYVYHKARFLDLLKEIVKHTDIDTAKEVLLSSQTLGLDCSGTPLEEIVDANNHNANVEQYLLGIEKMGFNCDFTW